MQQLELIRPSPISRPGPMATVWGAIRPWLRGRRGVIIAGVAIVAAGFALGWNWLTAIGAAPIILALAPCAAMCALGTCMMGRAGRSSCASGAQTKLVQPDGAGLTVPPDASQLEPQEPAPAMERPISTQEK